METLKSLGDRVISVGEAASIKGCDGRTIRRAIADGRVKAQRIGMRTFMVNLADVLMLELPGRGVNLRKENRGDRKKKMK